MNTRLRALTLGLGLFCCTAASEAQEPGCYSRAIPRPAVQRQTIVLIDLTTAVVGAVVESFRDPVGHAAAQPGQRYVVLTSFASIALGQRLTKHLDRVVEAPIDEPEMVENLPIRAFRQSQARAQQALASTRPSPRTLSRRLARPRRFHATHT
jgi:hypothetical protein